MVAPVVVDKRYIERSITVPAGKEEKFDATFIPDNWIIFPTSMLDAPVYVALDERYRGGGLPVWGWGKLSLPGIGRKTIYLFNSGILDAQMYIVASHGYLPPVIETWAAGAALVTHPLMDGTINNDTVMNAPTRGSIVSGNATPLWDELILGAANAILASDGTDLAYATLAAIIKNAIMTADGDLLIRSGGTVQGLAIGAGANILTSDSIDPTWQSIVNILGVALLTADGDIIIRSGGVVKRRAKKNDNDILTLVAGVPDWVAPVSAGWTEGARAYNSSAITLTTGVTTLLTFDSELYDTDNIHDLVSNTGRLTCRTAGKYLISGQVSFAQNGTGLRLVRIKVNGSVEIGEQTPAAIGMHPTRIAAHTQYNLAVNDYVELFCHQASGGNLNIEAIDRHSPQFAMQRIG